LKGINANSSTISIEWRNAKESGIIVLDDGHGISKETLLAIPTSGRSVDLISRLADLSITSKSKYSQWSNELVLKVNY